MMLVEDGYTTETSKHRGRALDHRRRGGEHPRVLVSSKKSPSSAWKSGVWRPSTSSQVLRGRMPTRRRCQSLFRRVAKKGNVCSPIGGEGDVKERPAATAAGRKRFVQSATGKAASAPTVGRPLKKVGFSQKTKRRNDGTRRMAEGHLEALFLPVLRPPSDMSS